MLREIFLLLVAVTALVQSLGLNTCESHPSVRINKLDISPPDLHPGQDVTINADWTVDEDISKPVKAEFKFFKSMGFLRMELPCSNNVGSCTYNNICRVAPGTICDFSRGHHGLAGLKIKVPSIKNAAGTYDMEVRVSDASGRKVGCWTGRITVR